MNDLTYRRVSSQESSPITSNATTCSLHGRELVVVSMLQALVEPPAAGGSLSRQGGTAAGGEAAAANLELGTDNVTGSRADVVCTGHRCGIRMCGRCGPRLGRSVRARLEERSGLFAKPMMMTLTVDQAGTKSGGGFPSPGAAHAYVRHKRLIPRLMRELGVDTWFYVLEFQKNAKGGWPHWHVLIDASRLPGGRVDFRKAWEIWLERFKVGMPKFSVEGLPRGFKNPVHAIRYITKYLTKRPEDGFPEWVSEERDRVRFLAASRRVGALVAAPRAADVEPSEPDASAPIAVEDDERDDEQRIPPDRGSYGERLKKCGGSCDIWRRCKDGETITYKWAGWVACTHAELVEGILAGSFPHGQVIAEFKPDAMCAGVQVIFPETISWQDLDWWVHRHKRRDASIVAEHLRAAGWIRDDSGRLSRECAA